ncbi:MAG: excinuclease ABC subunit UvrB [Patescibacteria group bacterium]|jgi:excinuclease ABC subunit B
MKFKLISKFEPKGDQPQAIDKLYNNLKNKQKFQTLLGVTGSGKTFTMAKVIEKNQKPTLVICHNKTLAAQLASEFKSFFPDNAVHYFVSFYDYYQPESYMPVTDTYIAKDASINEEIERLRHAATESLLTRKDVIIVASVSCIYGLGSPAEYQKESIKLTLNGKIELPDLLRQLTSINYERDQFTLKRGTFRVRGDIVDIFPPYSINEIVRIELFGNKIEKISKINYLTGEIIRDSLEKKYSSNIREIVIFPASHYIAPHDKFNQSLKQISQDMILEVEELKKRGKELEAQRLKQRTEYDLEMLKETSYCNGIENYSRYFDGRKPGQPPYTLMDFFPQDFLMFIDESHMTIPQIGGMYYGDRARKESLVQYGFRLHSAFDNRPLKFNEFEKHINQCIFVSATPGPYEFSQSKIKQNSRSHSSNSRLNSGIVEQIIRPTGLIDPKIDIKPTKNQIDDLLIRIQNRIKNKQRVLVTTLTKKLAEELTDYLKDLNLKVAYLHSDIATLKRLEILRDLRLGNYNVLVGINLLREGLDLPEVSLVAILDADKEGFLRSEQALIQTMGRAARHIDGQVIMYADTITGSMKKAISETSRRRKIQVEYNKKHHITPKTIEKEIKDERLAGQKSEEEIASNETIKIAAEKSDPKKIKILIKELTDQMNLSARNLEFEEAAKLRDEIRNLRKALQKLQ